MASSSTAVTLAEPDDEKGLKTTKVTLFEEEFTIVRGVNTFGLSQAFDPENLSGISRYMINAVSQRDRQRFMATFGRQHDLTADQMIEAFNTIVEAQSGGRPTKPSSGSSVSTTKRAVTRRSAAP